MARTHIKTWWSADNIIVLEGKIQGKRLPGWRRIGVLDWVKNGKGYANFKRCAPWPGGYKTAPALWESTRTHRRSLIHHSQISHERSGSDELMNASHSTNLFTNSCDHISTNGKAPLHSHINQNNPQFLYSLWRRANTRNVSFLNLSRW